MPDGVNNQENITSTSENAQNKSLWWHTPISAGMGGAVGGWVCFAMEGLKKRRQSDQIISARSFHPVELLRGSTAFSTSVGTTSVAQFTFNKLLHSLPGYNEKSAIWNAGTAIASGGLGAFFSAFVENVILQQQLAKSGPINAIKALFKHGYTRPWLGLPELAVREGGFALTMLWMANAVKEMAHKKTDNEYVGYASELGVGVAGAVATHAADTTATHKQRYLVTTSQAISRIYKQDGIRGFYKGVGWRAGLFTGCMITIPAVESVARQGLENIGSLKSTVIQNVEKISSRFFQPKKQTVGTSSIQEQKKSGPTGPR